MASIVLVSGNRMLLQQKSKMWEWLRNWAMGMEDGINKHLKCIEVAINRCLVLLSEGLQENEATVTRTQNQEELYILIAETSATLLHVVI